MPRALRLGRNQELFRLVNDEIAGLTARWGSEELQIICECVNTGCSEMLPVSFEEYEQVRANPGWFVIAEGHIDAEGECVIELRDGYHIVKAQEVDGASSRTR